MQVDDGLAVEASFGRTREEYCGCEGVVEYMGEKRDEERVLGNKGTGVGGMGSRQVRGRR